MQEILSAIKFNSERLVPVIAQQYDTGEVLMLAWMNEEAVKETIKKKQLCYYSRSRGKLWFKGESSGQTQSLKELLIDCDGDSLLALVDQKGVACHTGRRNCFFNAISDGKIVISHKPLIDPDKLYKNEI